MAKPQVPQDPFIEKAKRISATLIRDGRKKLGLSQMEFATLIGVGSTRTIQLWEAGKQLPDGENWVKLSRHLPGWPALVGSPPRRPKGRSNPGYADADVQGMAERRVAQPSAPLSARHAA